MLTTRNRWIAFILTQICPGWGQIYNRDWKWLKISIVLTMALTVYSTVYLFDSLKEIVIAIVLGLVLDLGLSVQAFVKAKRNPVIERAPIDYRWWHILFRIVVVYVGFALVMYAVPDFYGILLPTRLRSFQIPSESMVPNLLVGDRLVADGWAYLKNEPQRGDVIVFDYPKEPTTKYVKRLVGLPGDVVEFKQGELYLNGKMVPQRRAETFPLEASNRQATEYLESFGDKEHVIFRSQPGWNENYGPMKVPEGHYFMLGDNRDHSADSRFWGFVSRDQIIGRMAYIYFSWNADVNAVRLERVGMQVK
jgi:signal peptidase I